MRTSTMKVLLVLWPALWLGAGCDGGVTKCSVQSSTWAHAFPDGKGGYQEPSMPPVNWCDYGFETTHSPGPGRLIRLNFSGSPPAPGEHARSWGSSLYFRVGDDTQLGTFQGSDTFWPELPVGETTGGFVTQGTVTVTVSGTAWPGPGGSGTLTLDLDGVDTLNGWKNTGRIVVVLGKGGGGTGSPGDSIDTGDYHLSALCTSLVNHAMAADFVSPKGECGPADGSGFVLPGYDWADQDTGGSGACNISNGDIAYAVDECWAAVCNGRWGHPDFAEMHDDNAAMYVNDARDLCGSNGQVIGDGITCRFEQIWACP